MGKAEQTVGRLIFKILMLLPVVLGLIWMALVFLSMVGIPVYWSISSTIFTLAFMAVLVSVFLFFYIPSRKRATPGALLKTPLILRCPKCNVEVPIDAELCTQCGTRLPPHHSSVQNTRTPPEHRIIYDRAPNYVFVGVICLFIIPMFILLVWLMPKIADPLFLMPPLSILGFFLIFALNIMRKPRKGS
ncbi:zinc ribbon domain-containing protein [Candidatus Bathyarchaeota archaeon]|nr:zinc ribbon domain-containing protein [Candidatus Bathyarchaeota archaeon]